MKRIAVLALCTALTGCAADAGSFVTGSPAPSTTAPSATPTPSPTEVAMATDLEDGRHHAWLKGFDPEARTVTVDVVQFYSGDAAIAAAVEDGYDEDDVANDYYMRNQSPRLRTLRTAADLEVVVNFLVYDRNDGIEDTEITVAELAELVGKGQDLHVLLLVDVKDGVVVRLHEKYLP